MSRKLFVESWLMEMPRLTTRVDGFFLLNDFVDQLVEIKNPIEISQDFWFLDGSQTVFYWFQKDAQRQIIVELSKTSQNLTVNLVGKNPQCKNTKPYTSDLYEAIINHCDKSLRFTSDKFLTIEGFSVWKRLFEKGLKIGIYNNSNPGESFQYIKSLEEMNGVLQEDRSFENFQFVILNDVYETVCVFHTRKFREKFQIL